MERRIYRGEIYPEDLADYLVGHYDPQENLQAQDISEGTAHVVQIGRGDIKKELRHAVTVAITEAPDSDDGIAVTMGQQQWLDQKMGTFSAVIALVGVLVTPWALFGLLWPISDLIGSTTLPGDIWSTIDAYVLSHGGHLEKTEDLKHPHVLQI